MVIRYNYVMLLIGLLCLIIADPLTETIPKLGGGPVLEIAALVTMVFGVWSLVRSRTYFFAGWAMGVLVFALNGAQYFLDIEYARLAMWAVIAVFLTLIAGIVLRDILFAPKIDLNRLVGATCVYLLIGLIFAVGYFFLNAAVPGSFDGIAAGDWKSQLRELIYHSFVTLTTVGYGDVIPISPLARTTSFLEAARPTRRS